MGTFVNHCCPLAFGKRHKLPRTNSSASLLSENNSWEDRTWTPKQRSKPHTRTKNLAIELESFTRAHSRSVPQHQWKIAIFLSRHQLKGPLSCTLIQIMYKDNSVIFHNMVTVIPLLLKSNCSVIMISMFSDTL